MEKHFCDYNQSLALKKLGFEENCLASWNFYTNEFNYNSYPSTFSSVDVIQLPLKSQVFEWFREKHKIEAVVACYYSKILDISYGERQYHCHIVRDGVTTKGPKFKTYDEAESKTIDKLIEIVKTNLDK